MTGQTKIIPKSWLAFDLNVLRRFRFGSVVFPFNSDPAASAYVKRLQARVMTNDPLRSAWTCNLAEIANNGERLTDPEVDAVLEDAYVPGYRLKNAALANWFSETDAWWFDNVRVNIEKLGSPMSQAIASSVAMNVGDYALSFKGEARELRRPLSKVFRQLLSIRPEAYNNGQNNICENKNADDFIAETPADLMFLRLPSAHTQGTRGYLGRSAWHEEWMRGNADFWEDLEAKMSGRLGASTETKSQYLHLLEQTLQRASHIADWAIAHVESGFIQTQDLVDTISGLRRVDTIYTKDFSELTGAKAVIITA